MSIEKLVQNARPSISENILYPSQEMPYRDEIAYVSLTDALERYLNDPHGIAIKDFMQHAYGIQDPTQFLADAGLSQYTDQKFQNGACISAVKSHMLTGIPYNLFTDIASSAHFSQKYGIPTAVLCITHEQDRFHTNPEKMLAFGKQPYFVGYDTKRRPQFTSIQVQPIAVRDKNGSINDIGLIDEAKGLPLRDIFVQAVSPMDARNRRAANFTNSEMTEFLEAAIGLSWKDILNGTPSGQKYGKVTVTDFHRFLFYTTLDRLRLRGIIPSSEEMPIIEGDIAPISYALSKHANLPDSTRETLKLAGKPQDILANLLCVKPDQIHAVANYLLTSHGQEDMIQAIQQHHERLSEAEYQSLCSIPDEQAQQILDQVMKSMGLIFQKNTGMLYHGEIADPATYYSVFSNLLDIDMTSLNEPSWYFTGKVARTQELLRKHDRGISTIYVPYYEVSDNYETRIHPTGKYFDVTQANSDAVRGIDFTNSSREEVKGISAKNKDKFYAAIESGTAQEYQRAVEAVTTDPVLGWYATVIANMPAEITVHENHVVS